MESCGDVNELEIVLVSSNLKLCMCSEGAVALLKRKVVCRIYPLRH